MKSFAQTRPWAIYLLTHPSRLLHRFRSESDASAHCLALKRLEPDRRYQVVYDPTDKRPATECSNSD
jgi:hypothetical protein